MRKIPGLAEWKWGQPLSTSERVSECVTVWVCEKWDVWHLTIWLLSNCCLHAVLLCGESRLFKPPTSSLPNFFRPQLSLLPNFPFSPTSPSPLFPSPTSPSPQLPLLPHFCMSIFYKEIFSLFWLGKILHWSAVTYDPIYLIGNFSARSSDLDPVQ